MSDYVQVQEDVFVLKSDLRAVSLNNDGSIWASGVFFPVHYATILRRELGLDRLAEENAMTIQCLEAIDKFVAWWKKQDRTFPVDESRRKLIEEQLALIPPQPTHFYAGNIVLEELGGRGEENPHNSNHRVVLTWSLSDGWCVITARQAPHDTFWFYTKEPIASYVHNNQPK